MAFKVQLRRFDTTDEDKLHGFHIHAKGDMNDACRAAEGHFNPHGRDHGSPDAEERYGCLFNDINEKL